MNITPTAAANILGTCAEAIVVVDGDGYIVYANRNAERLFAYGEGEMAGRRIEELMPSSFRHDHAAHREKFGKTPRARPLHSGLQLKGLRKNGEVFDIDVALTPIQSGDELLVSTTVRAVNDEDPEVAHSRNILESAPDAMITIDSDGKIAVVNQQAERMFGYARQEMLGQDIEMLLPRDARERHIKHRTAYARNPRLREMGTGMDLHGRRKDGSTFPVEIGLSPVPSVTGEFVSSVIRDVTARKKMEWDLIAARQEAERANKANSAFLAAASHDLRQPVQALSLLNGALRRTATNELVLEMVESQQQSLDAMTNLLNSLLDISRLDAGAVQPEFEVFPIQRIVHRLSSEFARQAQQKNLKFDSCVSEAIVRSDPHLLSEIIQNLVSNAIQYTNTGEISMVCHEADGKLALSVKDTGIGIAPDQIEQIFQEFHQIKVPGQDSEGFGLGLAIVHRLADLLQHDIDVQSVPGQGSVFTVSLPLAKPLAEDSATTADSAVDDAPPDVSGLIMLIEDDTHVSNAWSLLLEAEGFRVLAAASAREAHSAVQHLDETPQLIISDFHLLDGSTGVEAVAEIRRHFDQIIPAFIVSGDTSRMVQEARSTANCAIMNKPVNTERLLHAAKEAIATGVVPPD